MEKATTQTISTKLISTPTISVSSKFTALHIASIAWDLYCETAPTHFAGEFTVCEEGDFAMYGIEDSMDMAQHYYETAFGIGNSVRDNVEYSLQDAYDSLEDFYGDTCVREEVSETVYNAVANYTHDEEEDGYIVQDYAHLNEEQGNALPQQIAALEKQLATLKAKATASTTA